MATSGRPPCSETRTPVCCLNMATPYAFVDNVQSATRYDESNYVLYALDRHRGWSRLGAVDARLVTGPFMPLDPKS